ncbi:MAG: hypothetical protein IKJ78_05205 [Bacteroidales bacterium]|nr:hypothetical protein [Bacteroidales bacterium]
MKKTIALTVLAAALALAGAGRAQVLVNAGFINKNASVITTKVSNDSTYSGWQNIGKGFYVGFGYNFDIWKGIGVAPAVYFNYGKHSEAYSETFGGVDYNYTAWLKTMDLNIPLLITYKYEFWYDLLVGSVYVGPVFQMGLSSKGERVRTVLDEVEATPLDYYAADSNGWTKHTKYDLGIMIGTGFQAYGARFDIGYTFGILERSGEGIKDGKYESIIMGQFFVGLGYSFDPFPKRRKR